MIPSHRFPHVEGGCLMPYLDGAFPTLSDRAADPAGIAP